MKANTLDANWLYCIPAGRVAENQQGDSQEKTHQAEGCPGETQIGGRDTSGLKRASVKKAWRECIRGKCAGKQNVSMQLSACIDKPLVSKADGEQ